MYDALFPKQVYPVGVLAVNEASEMLAGFRGEIAAHFCMSFYSASAFEVHHSAAKWVSPARLHVFYQ